MFTTKYMKKQPSKAPKKRVQRFEDGGLVDRLGKFLGADGSKSKGTIYNSIDPNFSENSRKIVDSQMRAEARKRAKDDE